MLCVAEIDEKCSPINLFFLQIPIQFVSDKCRDERNIKNQSKNKDFSFHTFNQWSTTVHLPSKSQENSVEKKALEASECIEQLQLGMFNFNSISI